MSFRFFATNDDLLRLAEVLLASPGVRILESPSRYDLPNRQFDTVENLSELFEESYPHYSVWAEQTGAAPQPHPVTFNSETQKRLGAKGWSILESPSLISIERNNDQMGCLADTHVNFWTETGARQRSVYPVAKLDEVDWKALKAVAGRIQRTITKLSPARMRNCPIMPDAFDRVQSHGLALWNWGSPCSYPSDLIKTA